MHSLHLALVLFINHHCVPAIQEQPANSGNTCDHFMECGPYPDCVILVRKNWNIHEDTSLHFTFSTRWHVISLTLAPVCT